MHYRLLIFDMSPPWREILAPSLIVAPSARNNNANTIVGAERPSKLMKTSHLPMRDASIATPLAQYHLIKYFDSSVRRDRIVIIWRLVSKITVKVRIERCGKK
jgi:hypothetical protein